MYTSVTPANATPLTRNFSESDARDSPPVEDAVLPQILPISNPVMPPASSAVESVMASLPLDPSTRTK